MKLKKFFSIILITCLCALSISSIAFSASAGTSEIELLKIAISHIKDDVEELQALTENHGTIIEESQQEIELLKASITDIEAEIVALNGSLDEIDTGAIQEVTEKIAKLDEEVKAFEKNVNDKIAALEAKDKELTDKDAALEAKDKELADKNAELEQKIKELEDTITALENKIDEVEKAKELEEKETTPTASTGCASSIALSTLVTVCAIGTVFAVKKKENE
jgi:peptidoglycan hydrolase CwlO-like protein